MNRGAISSPERTVPRFDVPPEAALIQILWEYTVRPEKIVDFETHYAATGTWALLFQNAPAYRGTVLLRDAGNSSRYVTVDVWTDLEAYEEFRKRHADEYARLDRLCEEFTVEERRIGVFEVL